MKVWLSAGTPRDKFNGFYVHLGSAGGPWDHCTCARVGPHTTVFLHSASAIRGKNRYGFLFFLSFFLVFLGMKIITVKRPYSPTVSFQNPGGFVPPVCAAVPFARSRVVGHIHLSCSQNSSCACKSQMLVQTSSGVFSQQIFATASF